MNTRLSANLSVLGTSLMLILSFSFGFHSYTEAKKTIVTDLNQRCNKRSCKTPTYG